MKIDFKFKIPRWQQLKFLPTFLSFHEKRVIASLFLVIILSGGWLLGRLIWRHIEFVPRVGGEYTEALIGSPRYINPVFSPANDPDQDLTRLIYSSLFKVNEKMELEPDLALAYELSKDQKEYTIHLRSGVFWHDGVPFSADDVIFTVQIIQDPEIDSPLYTSFEGIEIEKINDDTVKFKLAEPYSPFIYNLTFGILPYHIWSDIPSENFRLAEYNLKPIGTGPFIPFKFERDRWGNITSYFLKRNEKYYLDAPYIQTIVFKFYPNLEEAIKAAQQKKVDGVSIAPGRFQEIVKKDSHLKIYNLNLTQYVAIFFNQKNEILKEKAVRLALAYALDKEKILEKALYNEGEIIHAPILPGSVGYNPEIKVYEYNLEEANRILEEAGWQKKEDGFREKKGKKLAFTLTTIDLPEYKEVANLLVDFWKKAGFKIELKIVSPDKFQREIIKPRNYHALLYGEQVGLDPDPYPFWHSSQSRYPGLNLAIFYHKDVDQLLEEARKTKDEYQRRIKYLHFQNILAEELPAIFLYNPTYPYALSKKIKGFSVERISVPSDRFAGIEKWYIKTKPVFK